MPTDRYRVMLECIPDGAYAVDGKGCISFWNRGMDLLTGRPVLSTVGKACHEVLRYEDKPGSPLPVSDYPVLQCLRSRSVVSRHLYMRDNEGGTRFVEELAVPLILEKKPAGALAVLRDNSRIMPVLEESLRARRRERLIPICAWCKKIRADDDSWERLEGFLTNEGIGVLSHGICEDCAETIFSKRVYLESYQQICKAISSSLSLKEVLDLIVRNAVRVMNVKASMLRLVNRDTKELEVAAHYWLSDRYVNKGPVEFDGSLDQPGKPLSIYDITKDPRARYRSHAEEEGIRSILSVPVALKDEMIGVLRMYTAEPVKYTPEDLKFMTAIAEQAATAIMNARIFERSLSHAREYLRVFQEVTRAVSSTLKLGEVLGLIVRKLPEVMDLRAATIRLLDEKGEKLELAAAYGLSDRYLGRGPVDAEENVREALQTRPVAIFNVSRDARVHYQREALDEGIASMLTLPIVARGKVIGVLRLLTDRPREFTEEDVAFSASLAEVCGTAIDNARIYERLHRQTGTQA